MMKTERMQGTHYLYSGILYKKLNIILFKNNLSNSQNKVEKRMTELSELLLGSINFVCITNF